MNNIKEKKVAAVLVNYNGYAYSFDTIKSLEKSVLAPKIILVDNNSENNEADALSKAFPDIIVIPSYENLGFAGGNNLGIKYALQTGYEYILLINNDTIVDPDMISELVKYANPQRVVSPIIFYNNDKDKIWFAGGKINRMTGNTVHILQDRKINSGKLTVCSFLSGCCMLIHRDIFNRVGFLDDTYFMYYEDADFSIRLKKYNIELLMDPKAKLWHKVGASSGGNESFLSTYYLTRNRLILIKKYPEEFSKIAYVFSIITRYFRMIQFYIRNKRSWRAFMLGISDAKKNIMGNINLH